MGTPDKMSWESEIAELPTYKELKPTFSSDSEVVYFMRKKVKSYEEISLFDLLEKMLRLNPASRFSAEECLKH